MGNNIKYHSVICILPSLLSSGCSGPDIATRLASSKLVGDGILAQEQAVQGETIIMKPKVKDLTEKSFNIRYIELSLGNGVPENVRDLAIEQCKSLGKAAAYKTSFRGSV